MSRSIGHPHRPIKSKTILPQPFEASSCESLSHQFDISRMLSAALTHNSASAPISCKKTRMVLDKCVPSGSMPSSRRWADITDDDDSEEASVFSRRRNTPDTLIPGMCCQVYVWDWEAFKREYLATHCRLTLMTPVCASVCLLATCNWAPRAAPLAPEAGAIVIDEARATVFPNR